MRDVLCPTCSRPVPSLLLDAAVQTPLYSVASHDASTQLPRKELFTGQASPSAHSRHRVSRSTPVSTPHMVDLLKRHRCDLVCVHLSQSRPHSHMSVPANWEHILCAQLPTKECKCRPNGNPPCHRCRPSCGTWTFSKASCPGPLQVKLGQVRPDGLGHIVTADSDLMHHQHRLSVLQWNPGPARRNPTNIIAATCGRFHAVILQEASDHVPHVSVQFIEHTGNTDLAILLNKNTFEPDPMVFAFNKDSTSKGTWGMALLIVRGLLRRPSHSGTPTVHILLCTHSQCRCQEA